MRSNCIDTLHNLPLFPDIEEVFGVKLVTSCRTSAIDLICNKVKPALFTVMRESSRSIAIVDLETESPCSCKAPAVLCGHLLAVWSKLESADAEESIARFLDHSRLAAERYQIGIGGCGSKSGKKRRRGTESTRVRNNLTVGVYMPNPYGRISTGSEASVAGTSSMDISEDDVLSSILQDTQSVLDDSPPARRRSSRLMSL